jgi:hypothetical protein
MTIAQQNFALAHPVFDPDTQIERGHYWCCDPHYQACLTVNIGMESARYAGGRPLWHLSLSYWETPRRHLPVLRWSPTVTRNAEAIRDQIFRGAGTGEPLIYADMTDINPHTIIGTWRKPLRVDEVNRMAPTPEVLARPGRA